RECRQRHRRRGLAQRCAPSSGTGLGPLHRCAGQPIATRCGALRSGSQALRVSPALHLPASTNVMVMLLVIDAAALLSPSIVKRQVRTASSAAASNSAPPDEVTTVAAGSTLPSPRTASASFTVPVDPAVLAVAGYIGALLPCSGMIAPGNGQPLSSAQKWPISGFGGGGCTVGILGTLSCAWTGRAIIKVISVAVSDFIWTSVAAVVPAWWWTRRGDDGGVRRAHYPPRLDSTLLSTSPVTSPGIAPPTATVPR